MSIDILKVDSNIEKTNTDSLGGGFTKPTGLYGCVVDVAYLNKSRGGALGLNLHLRVASDKSIIRETLWVTSGDAKGNKYYYENKDGKRFLLPGMATAEQIAMITTGKPMGEQTQEEKTVKLWDPESRAEKPTKVPVLTDMVGKSILVGIHKVDRNRWSGGAPTAEHSFVNQIDKVFYPDGFSTMEREAEAEQAKVHIQWQEKYSSDFVKDEYDPSVGGGDDSLPSEAVADTGSLFS